MDPIEIVLMCIVVFAAIWAIAPDLIDITRRFCCRIGIHYFVKKIHKCYYCNAPKKHHLQLLDGGKKVFERKRKI